MRCLCKLLSVCAIFLVAAGCGGKKDDDGFESVSIDNYPTFANTSDEPVLLRYKFKTGQSMKITFDMDMNSLVKQGEQKVDVKVAMAMEAMAAITAVDPQGNISADVKITHMKMNITGGPQNVEFDSDGGGNPALDGLRGLINVSMPCKITPTGKLLENDIAPLMQALDRMGNAAMTGQLKDMFDQMVEGTFTQLSEKAVKAGETYQGGTLKMGGAKAKVSYKVRSVSGDKTQAVLEPVADLNFSGGMFQGAEITVRKQDFGGWMLFDVQKGYSPKAEGQISMVLDVKVQGQSAAVTVKGKVVTTTTLQ